VTDTLKPALGSPDGTDAARELVRREVDRANPAEGSRRAIELIVETALLTKAAETGSEGLEARIRNHVETLRREHPRLFENPGSEAGRGVQRGAQVHHRSEPSPAGDIARPAMREPPISPGMTDPAAPSKPRDWLTVSSDGQGRAGPTQSSRDAPPPRAPAAAAGRSSAEEDRFGTGRVRPVPIPLPGEGDHPDLLAPDLPRAGWLSFSGLLRPATLAVVALPLLIGGLLFAWFETRPEAPRGREAAVAERTLPEKPEAREPATTGGVRDGAAPGENRPAEAQAEPVRGVAEVLDTTTLNIQGQVVRLFGVEWVRGAGDPDDLARYLRGREVACEPAGATKTHRCEVGGQDLSRVVLFNGGGRATQDATPELRAAEEHAKSAKLGLWSDQRLIARP
jgi:endonuclease YncB( thermonuclease family)